MDIPTVIDETSYNLELARHLHPIQSGPTPFISISQRLMRVITHAYRCSQLEKINVEEWEIAVINLSTIASNAKAVWEISAVRSAWKAYGEWVVYGAIPAANVLHVLPMSQLLETMSENINPFYINIIKKTANTRSARNAMKPFVSRPLTFADGIAMGHLMSTMQIPRRHVDKTMTLLLHDWHYTEHKNNAWLSNHDFVQGREYAYLSPSSVFRTLASEGENTTKQGDGLLGNNDQAPRHIPAATEKNAQHGEPMDDSFQSFINEMERAAFGESQSHHCLPEGRGSRATEHTTNQTLTLKKESPELEILDTIPDCFG
ncbi:MAG: hypothetical protein Q9220_001543 [cf. Caloplaca sp. 1 TL-2023]